MLEKILEWDREILITLNNLGTEDYDNFWLIITKFPTWIPLFVALILIIFWKNKAKEALWALLFYSIMIIVLTLTIFFVKEQVGRLRPNNDETINLLIRVVHSSSDFSFFSGHAASSFGITAMAVLLLRKKLPLIYLIWIYPLLFSYSRIYLGVHYPFDIIVGALVGCLFAYTFYRIYLRFRAPYLM